MSTILFRPRCVTGLYHFVTMLSTPIKTLTLTRATFPVRSYLTEGLSSGMDVKKWSNMIKYIYQNYYEYVAILHDSYHPPPPPPPPYITQNSQNKLVLNSFFRHILVYPQTNKGIAYFFNIKQFICMCSIALPVLILKAWDCV